MWSLSHKQTHRRPHLLHLLYRLYLLHLLYPLHRQEVPTRLPRADQHRGLEDHRLNPS